MAGSYTSDRTGRARPVSSIWIVNPRGTLVTLEWLRTGCQLTAGRKDASGLERQDMSVPRRRVHIRRAQVDDELDDTKSGKSDRMIIFDKQTAAVLGSWERCQQDEREMLGSA